MKSTRIAVEAALKPCESPLSGWLFGALAGFTPRVMVLVAVFLAASRGIAGEPTEPVRQAVLDSRSYWRAHVTLRPELFGSATNPYPRSKAPTITEPPSVVGGQASYTKLPAFPPDQPSSPLPTTDWMKPDYDDSTWWRTVGPFFVGETPTGLLGLIGIRHSRAKYDMPYGLALLCLRGHFIVTDPGKVKELSFSAAYRGGIIVYLNGQEVARSHLPQTEHPGFEALAEDCPAETTTGDDGKPITEKEMGMLFLPDKEMNDQARLLRSRVEKRVRHMDRVVLPARLLRKGANILAIEVHRTAISEAIPFCPVGITEIELAAIGEGGIEPNLSRPAGIQVWAADPMEDILTTDHAGADSVGRPVRLVGARNGAFNGQIVISSWDAIKEPRAVISSLVSRAGAARIDASNIVVSYPLPVAGVAKNLPARRQVDAKTRSLPCGFSALSPVPPSVVSVDKRQWARPEEKGFGAVQPVWITVNVPKEATPGMYEGTATVSVAGQRIADVQVQLNVCDWTIPDRTEYRTMIDFIQSPESLAEYYRVPLWSAEHVKLIDRSLKLLAGAGSKSVYVPLIAKTHMGNEQSMVYWIRTKDGGFDFDFSVMDRYLDLCIEHMGKPRVLCLLVYDFHLGTGERHSGWYAPGSGEKKLAEAVPVSFLDKETGKVEVGAAPLYGDPAGKPAWQALADKTMEKLKARGLDAVTRLGLVGDRLPPKEYVLFWREILPSVDWAMHSHGMLQKIYTNVPISYNAFIYGARYAVDPACKRYYGWQRDPPATFYPRNFDLTQPRAGIRLLSEWSIQGSQNGLGRLPADFLPIPTARKDRPMCLYDRNSMECFWGNVGLNRSGPWLAAGPEGAVATIRFELLREGVQECEARIFLEKSVLDSSARSRMGEELSTKVQSLLDERTRYNQWVFRYLEAECGSASCVIPGSNLPVTWFAGSGWQDRSEKLFSTAGAVAKALDAK